MKRDVISIGDLDRHDLERYLTLAEHVEATPPEDKVGLLTGKLLMVIFYEPSTRTRLSFEAAMTKLGGSISGFSDTVTTSVAKGESFRDTVKTVEQYADILVIRHPKEGAARLAAEIERTTSLIGDGPAARVRVVGPGAGERIRELAGLGWSTEAGWPAPISGSALEVVEHTWLGAAAG